MKPGFGRRCDWWLILFLGAFLLFSPVTATATGLGNISPIIGALCVWAGVMHTRRHYMLAAILIAFASILKIIPGLLLIFMFWRGAGTRNGRLMLAAVTGAFIAAAGILLMPGTADFLKGAGGATKWGIDIGGAAVSIHVWLARLLDNPAINHPDSAMVVFAAGGVLASLYGYFMNHREMVSWGTVMVLADVTSPKNCPHLFLSMVFPVLVMFARHTAVTFAVDTTAAASKQPGPARTSSGGFISMILTGQVPASTGITRFGGFAFALSLPWIAVSSEYFYLKGSLTGEIILPLLPVTLILLQTWVLNRWNRTASKK